MITLSLAMIVKNEEEVLERCLKSVRGVFDEIIIIDTGSTDRTINIAKKYTNKVYQYKWNDNFADARNFSFDRATKEYIMWLDADDYLELNEHKKLLHLKKTFDKNLDLAFLKYNIGFDELGNVTFSYYRERIFKRASNFRWQEPVHECITPCGNSQKFDIAITHGHKIRTHSDRNLKIYEKQIAEQKELSCRGTFYYARELKNHNRYSDSIAQYKKFLESEQGWREDCIQACLDLSFIYQTLNDDKLKLKYLYETFMYDLPRAETCCKIGYNYFDKRDYKKAIYWYELAIKADSSHEEGFVQKDYKDFIPNLQLCLCHDQLKDYKKAYEYHLVTKKIKPDNRAVKYNDEYFIKVFLDQPKQ